MVSDQRDKLGDCMHTLRLKKGEGKRLGNGHLWIFSNEVDTAATPLTQFEPGEQAMVMDAGGQALGLCYVNPKTLICARILTRDAQQTLDTDFFRQRFKTALALRQALFDAPCYRLVHGEADFLPGLVVDRYADTLVVQVGAAGMERLLDPILQALLDVLAPKAVLLKNDAAVRELEGLERYVRPAYGEPPAEVEIAEQGLRFVAPLLSGQKTGFYYDMRDNRVRFAALTKSRDTAAVFDGFSYVGAFGVRAAVAGARRVLCVDSSEAALHYARENSRLNGVAERVETIRADVLDVIAESEPSDFDLVSVDPPAFIKRKKDLAVGRQAYKKLNAAAMKLVRDGGFLLSCSCSQHLAAEELLAAVQRGAARRSARVQLLWRGGQAPDHPVHPAMPETEYLTALCCRVLHGG